jgi:hypothetical protein
MARFPGHRRGVAGTVVTEGCRCITRRRRYEYDADLAAATIGLAPQLISALSKITVFEGGRTDLGGSHGPQLSAPPRCESRGCSRSSRTTAITRRGAAPTWRMSRGCCPGCSTPVPGISRLHHGAGRATSSDEGRTEFGVLFLPVFRVHSKSLRLVIV